MTRWLRRTAWALAGLLALLAAAAAGLWFARHVAVERAIVTALAERGIAAELTVAELDAGHARLVDVALGDEPALTARAVTIAFDLGRLVEGEVDAVTVEGPVLRAAITAGGVTLGSLDPALAGDGGAPGPLPRLAVRGGRIELDTPLGPGTVQVDGTLTPRAAGRLEAAGSLEVQSRHIDFTGTMTATGTFEEAELALTVSDGRAAWPDGAVEALAGNAALTVGAGGVSAARLALRGSEGHAGGVALDRLDLTAKLLDETVAAVLEGTAEGGAVTLEATANADLGTAPTLLSSVGTLRLTETTAALAALGVPALRKAALGWEFSGAGDPVALDGGLSVEFDAAQAEFPGGTAEAPRLRYPGSVDWRDGTLALSSDRPVKLAVESAAADGVAALDASLALEAGRAGGPILRWEPATGAWTLDAEIATAAFAATAEGTRLRGGTPALHVSGGADGLTVTSEGGRVELPDEGIAAAGIEAAFDTAAESGTLRVGSVSDTAQPAAFAPAVVEGTIGRAGAAWAFDGTAWLSRGRAAADIAARLDPADGAGRIDWTARPVRFAADGLQPADLGPVLADTVTAATGAMRAKGSVRWGAAPLRIAFEAVLDGLSFEAGGVPMHGLNGTVHYDSRAAEPAFDTLTLDRAELGLPLSGVRSELRLMPDFVLDVRAATGAFADGRVSAEPFRIDPRDATHALVLDAEGVSLARLLALADVPGLDATGTLAGRVPVSIEDGDAVIRNGRLAATEPGRLVYAPKSPPEALSGGGQGVALMLQAFENFHYDTLTAEIEKAPGGEAEIGLHLSGRNPDALEGQLFNFNITLSGNVTDIMNCALRGECGAGAGLRLGQ